MLSEPLVVTFADAGYLPLLSIWIDGLQRLGLQRIRVYSLDSLTEAWCREREIDTILVNWQGELRELWIRRIQVFSSLLADGEEFIHSDSDAIWLGNPLQQGTARHCKEDLVFSQGTVWPPDVHRHWGFVLCCGWFWARPTAAARAFFHALEQDVRVSGDDQLSVNRLLAAAGLQWNTGISASYELQFRDRRVRCWPESLHATISAAPLLVALLPQREFQRLPESSDRAIVKHYVTPKNCEQKLQVMRKFGLIE